MELCQFCYFIVVVEEMNIMWVVEWLYMMQLLLSCQFQVIEEEIGLLLFECGVWLLKLIDVGCVFYVQVKCLVDQVDELGLLMWWFV